MRTLNAALRGVFKAPAPRKPDPHAKKRVEAKRLAKQHGIEIEKIDSCANVWPPRSWKAADPWEGDHYAQTWAEVLLMVRTYAGLEPAPEQTK